MDGGITHFIYTQIDRMRSGAVLDAAHSEILQATQAGPDLERQSSPAGA